MPVMLPLPWEIAIPTPVGREDDGAVLLMAPNAIDSAPIALTLQGESVSVPSAAGFLDKDGARPAGRYEFEFLCASRAELAFLQGFFDAKLGRARGFWFPTWQWELELAPYWANPGDGSDVLWLIAQGYGASLWPLGGQYRRFLVARGTAYSGYLVDAVTLDNPAGSGYERLLVTGLVDDANPRVTIPRPWDVTTGVRPLWLRYGRFDQDVFTVDTSAAGADGGGRVTLALLELPDEAYA